MVYNFNDFLNENLLKGKSNNNIKDVLNGLDITKQHAILNRKNIKFTDVYTEDEINNMSENDKFFIELYKKYDTIQVEGNGNIFIYSGNMVGMLDSKGNMILDVIYDTINTSRADYYKVRKGMAWGVIDTNGNEIVPIKYRNIHDINGNNDDILFIVNDDYNLGCYDKNSELIIPIKYDAIEAQYGKDILYIRDKSSKWALYNRKGEQLSEHKYDNIHAFDTPSAKTTKVSIDNLYGAINDKGDEIIPVKYSIVYKSINGILPVMNKRSKWGFFNEQGKKIDTFKYDDVVVDKDTYDIKVLLNDEWEEYNK